jgi:NAD(P)H-hydrate epimerase
MAKVGLVTNVGSEYAGKIEVVDIGIPKDMTQKLETGFNLITPDLFKTHFGPRPNDSHKGDFGRLLVIGGSTGKIGAGLLASRAALRSGAGLVTYALPEVAYSKFDVKSPEIMYEGISDGGKGSFTKDSLKQLLALVQDKTVLAIGPGIGTAGDVKDVVLELIKKTFMPIVLDADGLNCVADSLGHLKGRKGPLILTPHPGEMARLANTTAAKVQSNRIETAKAFAKNSGHYLVLKGHRTVVATPQGLVYINATGNPGMASAGQGDVLTGIISGFIAQKIPILESILAAVYIHGAAGDIALSEMGERGLIASDVINNLPKAIQEVNSKQ